MSKPLIVADDKIPFLKGAFELAGCQVIYLPGSEINAEAVKYAEVVVTRTRTRCDAALLDHSKVKLIATATIGYDHIDTAYCAAHNIEWTNAPGCNAGSVGQYIASVVLTLGKRYGFVPTEKKLGVIGVGHTGEAVLRFAHAVGMKTLLKDPPRTLHDRTRHWLTLEEILAQADIITVHTPVTERTRGLANDAFFSTMRNGAFFINASRGEYVCETSLLSALESGKLTAAALDVWQHEPNIDASLHARCDVATPHIAGYSADGKYNGTFMTVQAVSKRFGLGLDHWKPPPLPPPANEIIDFSDRHNATLWELLTAAVLATYNPMTDDRALRDNPAAFESLRGHYRIRREFSAYTVCLPSPIASDIFHALGFKVIR